MAVKVVSLLMTTVLGSSVVFLTPASSRYHQPAKAQPRSATVLTLPALPVLFGSLRVLPWSTLNGRVAGARMSTVPCSTPSLSAGPFTKLTFHCMRFQVPTMATSASGMVNGSPLASVTRVGTEASESV